MTQLKVIKGCWNFYELPRASYRLSSFSGVSACRWSTSVCANFFNKPPTGELYLQQLCKQQSFYWKVNILISISDGPGRRRSTAEELHWSVAMLQRDARIRTFPFSRNHHHYHHHHRAEIIVSFILLCTHDVFLDANCVALSFISIYLILETLAV